MARANVDELVDDATGPCVFRREGEYWTIAYAGSVFRLRHVKGMGYLAHLLGRPGERIPAGELAAAPNCGMGNADCGFEDGENSAIHNPQSAMDERARLRVTQSIKAALKKIESHDPSLGHHLSTCIRTGHLCAYVPDPSRRVAWVLR
jgi:hypothetical protein